VREGNHDVDPQPGDPLRRAVTSHPRRFESNRYVYPVISRRSGGVSVGINLNPDKVCNFGCIYCQVDRHIPPAHREVDLDLLERELRALLADALSGSLFGHASLRDVPDHLKRVRDIAFSGDGEPTTFPRFAEAVDRVSAVREQLELGDAKLAVLTNATRFHRPEVQSALEVLHRNNGEVWAKLDAGTPAYYGLVDRSRVPFERIVGNLTWAARRWPLVIQTLFVRIHHETPPEAEILAYCGVLRKLLAEGGRLKIIQLHTVARPPAEDFVASLEDAQLDSIAASVREKLEGVPVEVQYGVATDT